MNRENLHLASMTTGSQRFCLNRDFLHSRSGSDSLPSPMTPQRLSSSPMRSLDYFDLTDNPTSLASEASPGTQGFSSGSDERLQDSLSRSFHSPQKVQNVS